MRDISGKRKAFDNSKEILEENDYVVEHINIFN